MVMGPFLGMLIYAGTLQAGAQLARCIPEVTVGSRLSRERHCSRLYNYMRAGRCHLLLRPHSMQVRGWHCMTPAWQPKELSCDTVLGGMEEHISATWEWH